MINDEILEILFANRDEGYRAFQAKLMPGVDIENIIGVRIPVLRKLAKELVKREDIEAYLDALPHKYYDENNLHAYILSLGKDYRRTVERVDALLPYVDNWATCDSMSPAVFKKNRTLLKDDIDRWLASDKTYTIRFGLEMIMSHFLDADFDPAYLEKAALIRSDEYYVSMMLAWLYATALAKQWDSSVRYVEDRRLAPWVHNKTIQKAVESYRITDEQKDYLRTLKIK